jgi:DivIVA domain-containing protein
VKRKGTTDPEGHMFTAPAPASPPASVLTPSDIQSKEFRVARMGGYRMRDVDEFLDQVTDAMSGLLEENERLREAAGSSGMSDDVAEARIEADRILEDARRDASEIRADAGTAAGSGSGDTSVRAFLRKEKDFLQSLGALVQGHAEVMKSMARAARPAPAPASAATDASADEPSTDAPDPEATAAMPRDELGEGASEPINVNEPEPAGSRRAEEGKHEASLRDLFWGEES